MSPDRLFHSLAREVVYHRPQDFKVPALTDIKALFTGNSEVSKLSYGIYSCITALCPNNAAKLNLNLLRHSVPTTLPN
eukprot:COSAG05_NODE_438_length_9828_cov_4.712201_12_plen_78_part_00